MILEVDLNALKVSVFSTVFILFKFLITISIQGGKRFDAGSRPPEDVMFKVGGAQNFGASDDTVKSAASSKAGSPAKENVASPKSPEEDAKVAAAKLLDIRWQRIVQNDLENIPLAFIVIWAGVLSNSQPVVHMVCCLLYIVCRALHTYCYAYQLQPHRTIVWMTAIFAELVIALNALICVFLIK